jgi:uridine phosphorylase
VALFHPGVGAPLAAGLLEGVIAFGCRDFVICGGAGALESTLAIGHVIVPVSAVRDEGTSYHYLPPAREVEASLEVTAAVERVLDRRGIAYVRGKTWTTDAIFRETRDKIRRRREDGCLTVEMEAAALFAVARFRGARAAAVLYAGDDVGGETHDLRDWTRRTEDRERLFWVAAEACASL